MSAGELERLVQQFEAIQGFKGDDHRRMAMAAITAIRTASPPASEAGDGWIPFSVRARVSEAIANPGSVLPRIETDSVHELENHWQARAAIKAYQDARRHRTTEQPTATGEDEGERARIVSWLRDYADEDRYGPRWRPLHYAASAIVRGEHLHAADRLSATLGGQDG